MTKTRAAVLGRKGTETRTRAALVEAGSKGARSLLVLHNTKQAEDRFPLVAAGLCVESQVMPLPASSRRKLLSPPSRRGIRVSCLALQPAICEQATFLPRSFALFHPPSTSPSLDAAGGADACKHRTLLCVDLWTGAALHSPLSAFPAGSKDRVGRKEVAVAVAVAVEVDGDKGSEDKETETETDNTSFS
ncbi:unnamed protein product [Diplocarpon coronariae]|nr:hypothetical protein JHW43_005657 [Diplocarpon mali]